MARVTQLDLFRKRRKVMRTGRSEHAEQVMFVQWVLTQYPDVGRRLFAVPNGEYRTIQSAKRLKAEGTKSGVSDLVLLYPSERYFGLMLEFKRADETWAAVSITQREFLYQAEKDGYAAAVAFGFDHGVELLRGYLSGEEITIQDCKTFIKEKKKR